MNQSDISVRLLGTDQIQGLAAHLTAAGLPTQDLLQPGRMFYSFHRGETELGYGGIEGSGRTRLIRSLVVVPAQRKSGIGNLLLRALERIAEADGAQSLHLLTTTAPDFFAARGYEQRDRSQAPKAISSSEEFNSLCPTSAVYMVKELGDINSVSPQVTRLHGRQ
ncbi:arsenic resistance N-acetyltransferase ArsN2 [Pseudomonas asiatica]|uniref:arsenic resistance N-acetyltransferase ArsN2 n=1 Tax=Pseudomonas asiatica TaxID=2219225 RepID=UPI0039B3C91E